MSTRPESLTGQCDYPCKCVICTFCFKKIFHFNKKKGFKDECSLFFGFISNSCSCNFFSQELVFFTCWPYNSVCLLYGYSYWRNKVPFMCV